MDVYIDIEKFKNDHYAGFEFLEVPSKIGNHGIGTTLMLSVIDTIRTFKEFYFIRETVRVRAEAERAAAQRHNIAGEKKNDIRHK